MENTNKQEVKAFEIGQICEKTCGKEKGRVCVVVSKEDDNFVVIDGDVKKRKCNVLHLKPLDKVIKIKEDEKTDKVKDALREAGFEMLKRTKVKERLRVKREAMKEIREDTKKKAGKLRVK